MGATSDSLTVLSSLTLRVCAYIFLRWIPGHVFPPVIYAALAVYIPSFLRSFFQTSPYKVLSDELDIIVKDTIPESDESEREELIEGAEDGPLQELDVQETVILEEKDPQVFQTMTLGKPSPTSWFWSALTFALNLLLVGFTLDLVYRAPIFHPEYDLSFARVGYVSDHSAEILVREPDHNQLPIFLSYRYAGPPLAAASGHHAIDTAWKSTGEAVNWLAEDTDFTAAKTVRGLRPDTRYQYALSNNHSGYFYTAPPVGEVSTRTGGKYTFLHSSCIIPRFPYNPTMSALEIPGLRHLAEWIPKLRAHFMLFLGDFIYVDVPKRHGIDIATYRREYRQVYASPDWPAASEELPWIHVIDDHEIANDWDKNTTGVYEAAIDPWHHYQMAVNPPVARSGQSYFQFTQGPAAFFMLDTRRYRDPEFDKDPNDAQKSMLGQQQLRDLLAFLRDPVPHGVRWKIVVSSVPFTQNWGFGKEDTWAGYLGERKIILEAMWDVGYKGGIGVVVLSGDRHEFAATSFPPPQGGRWPLSANVHEFSTSPLSQFYLPYRTYKERDGDVCIKYIPDGNSKFGAIEISSPAASEQSILHYRLFVDGKETWSYTITTPPNVVGGGSRKDAIWG